jgi:Dolichyl-phosphate-mannose-protein mannosyltransferase
MARKRRSSKTSRRGRPGEKGGGPRAGGKASEESFSGARPSKRRLTAILLLAALALVLRLWRLGGPVGGFHCFNEGNYLDIARNFSSSPLWRPTPDGHYVFLETPPLFSYVLTVVFLATGVSVAAARLVSVVSSLGLIAATGLLGSALFGAEAGYAAALMLAVSPVAVLTGRNIQTDSMMLCFLLLALLFYWRAETRGGRNRVASGILYGLALFTKLFAAVAGPALVLWEILTKKGLGWLKRADRWRAAAVAIALPGLFYGYHAVRNLAYTWHDVTGGAAVATRFPATAQGWSGLGAEAVWALSPVVALVVAVGALSSCRRPSREELFVLLPFACYAIFYLFIHKHSYYVLSLLPFGAILGGRFVASFGRRGLRTALLAGVALTGAFLSAVDLCSMKFGFSEFREMGDFLRLRPRRLLADKDLLDNAGTVVRFYLPSTPIISLEGLPGGPGGRLTLPAGSAALLYFVGPDARPAAGLRLFDRRRYALELFGWEIAEAHPNPHLFRQGAYWGRRSGGPLDFGLRELTAYPALAVYTIPAGMTLYRGRQGLSVGPADVAPESPGQTARPPGG